MGGGLKIHLADSALCARVRSENARVCSENTLRARSKTSRLSPHGRPRCHRKAPGGNGIMTIMMEGSRRRQSYNTSVLEGSRRRAAGFWVRVVASGAAAAKSSSAPVAPEQPKPPLERRLAPPSVAACIAADSCATWRRSQPPLGATTVPPNVLLALLFWVQEDDIAGEIEKQFDRRLRSR